MDRDWCGDGAPTPLLCSNKRRRRCPRRADQAKNPRNAPQTHFPRQTPGLYAAKRQLKRLKTLKKHLAVWR